MSFKYYGLTENVKVAT